MILFGDDENGLESKLKQLFGDSVYQYTDEQAVEDGVLIPFSVPGRDTGHRITSNAFATLQEHYRAGGYAEYSVADFLRLFFAEFLPLVPFAVQAYNQRGSEAARV